MPKPCTMDGCETRAWQLGLCSKHARSELERLQEADQEVAGLRDSLAVAEQATDALRRKIAELQSRNRALEMRCEAMESCTMENEDAAPQEAEAANGEQHRFLIRHRDDATFARGLLVLVAFGRFAVRANRGFELLHVNDRFGQDLG